MDDMEMDEVDSRHEIIANEHDVGSEAATCHAPPKQETLQSLEHTCCGHSAIVDDACASDQGDSEPAPLFCDCHAVDVWLIAKRTNDSPGTTPALNETNVERAPDRSASQIAHSTLKDPGSPPLNRTIVFGSFLT